MGACLLAPRCSQQRITAILHRTAATWSIIRSVAYGQADDLSHLAVVGRRSLPLPLSFSLRRLSRQTSSAPLLISPTVTRVGVSRTLMLMVLPANLGCMPQCVSLFWVKVRAL